MDLPSYELLALKGSDEIGRWSLTPGRFSIGRSPECSIVLEVDDLADECADLVIQEDGSILLEVGVAEAGVERSSMSGSVRIEEGQHIELGNVRLMLQERSPSQSVSVAEEPDDELPSEFRRERYEIGSQIAKGGMGAILNARQSAIRRAVAMKVILGPAEEDPWQRLRFIEEAQITGQLEHPNIVPVHDAGIDDRGRVFYTMKLVKGITLKAVLELLRKEQTATAVKYPLLTLLTIYQKVCDAVAFAHSKGVIHRDLKPENIMIGAFGEVLVMDWGLARLYRKRLGDQSTAPVAPVEEIASSRFDGGDGYATLAGSIMGTPAYMAPEQARGELERLDQRTDIFALGVILYEILTLSRAFAGKNGQEIMGNIRSGTLPPAPSTFQVKGDEKAGRPSLPHLKSNTVPESLSAVAMRALQHQPEDRYPGVEALQADLMAYQNGFATSAENAGAWRQIKLLIGRHKAAAVGLAAVLLVGTTLGTKAYIEGRRAEREAVRANAALADLRKTAPALRQLAESEAGFQRFDSALEKLDAALALDPADIDSYWRRVWILIGLEKWSDAAENLRIAREKDPKHADWAAILPVLEQLAATPEAGRWTQERVTALTQYLERAGANAQLVALSAKLRLGGESRRKLVQDRMFKWLGPRGKNAVTLEGPGWVVVDLSGSGVDTLEPLSGLPVDRIRAFGANVSSLEPLRGMKLNMLGIGNTKVTDLSPLAGMPLRELVLTSLHIANFSSLRGLPLEEISTWTMGSLDTSVLAGAPLRRVNSGNTLFSGGIAFLAAAPIEELTAHGAGIQDLSPLRGKPLRKLELHGNRISDLSPLSGAPIEFLDIQNNPLRDLTPLLALPKLQRLCLSNVRELFAPLRQHPTLSMISTDGVNYRPIAQFWAEYDAPSRSSGR